MSDIICEACGASNPPGAQFCTECDAYLAWSQPAAASSPAAQSAAGSTTATSATVATPPRVASANADKVVAPTVEIADPTITLDRTSPVPIDLHMLNPSPIVDGYVVETPSAPSWLVLHHDELRLLPQTDSIVTLSCAIADGPLPQAGTVPVDVVVRSLTDPEKSTPARIEVTVPRIGVPVVISAHPSVMRLLDETDGRVELSLDNSGSNYSQQVTVTTSDPEDVVQFSLPPGAPAIAAGATTQVVMNYRCPPLGFGETQSRQLTAVAHSGDATTEATIAVTQTRSEAPEHVPIKTRLEPSVIRVEDFTMADVTLVVDNRHGPADRTLTVGGRDPESKVRFTFPTSQIRVQSGKIATLPVTVEAKAPTEGADVSYPFSVIATDDLDEIEATGTLTLSSSPAAITTATLRLHPSKLSVRNSSRSTTAVIVDNTGSDRWLRMHLAGSDPEAAVNIAIAPPTVDVPPRQSVWAQATVAADPPGPGEQIERPITFVGTDGRSTVSCDGSFVQRTSDWMPVVRVILTLIGAVTAAAGAFGPWTARWKDYYITQLGAPIPKDATALVVQTQPPARLAVLILAGAMAMGVFAKTGKPTQTAALTMATAFIGYMVFLTQKVGTGGPMYGAVMVIVGAALGFLGGLCIRKR